MRTHYKHVEKMIYAGITYRGDIQLTNVIAVKDDHAFKNHLTISTEESLDCHGVYIEENYEFHCLGKSSCGDNAKVKIQQDTEDSRTYYVECYCQDNNQIHQNSTIWHRLLLFLRLVK